MRCPKCAHLKDKVVDSRLVQQGAVIRRRRICQACGHRFSTYEEVVRMNLRVVKRDGRHEPLDKRKLAAGLERACEKRPVSADQIAAMVESIVGELENEFDREVPSTAIGLKVMSRLEEIDDVAYVRFASVYRRFRDVNQFLNEIEGLIDRE